ncbi:30S ribosomal protein S8e [Candidatus Woesearchaeota archaeon]|nr:MAG: 30S ribosomal protein S8e [Candidatus Woesearchaeota archaeon]
MAIIQARSRRKPSGGRYKAKLIKKKKHLLGRTPALTKLDERKAHQIRVRGGHAKFKLILANKINVYDPKTKKHSVEDIETIKENTANSQFVRRNIMTKGAIVQTKKGKVKITSRPGQDAGLSGVLVE